MTHKLYTANLEGEKYWLADCESYVHAKNCIKGREQVIRVANRVIRSNYFDKFIVNGRPYWIEWYPTV